MGDKVKYDVKFTKVFKKNLKKLKLNSKDEVKVKECIKDALSNPFNNTHIEKLKSKQLDGTHRYKKGSHRLFFEMDKENKTLIFTNIHNRDSNTYANRK